MNKLIELVPRVKRESVFQYYLLKNNYKWVELCLDALIAGEEKLPSIPESILRENARLNGLYKKYPAYFDVKDVAKQINQMSQIVARLQPNVNLLSHKIIGNW